MLNNFCEITRHGQDLDGNLKPGVHTYLGYVCGHCTSVVIMRDDRQRPRNSCLTCGRWICESSEICNTHCTPLNEMARDHFEGAGDRGKYVPAIMQGVTSVDEANRLGLITNKE